MATGKADSCSRSSVPDPAMAWLAGLGPAHPLTHSLATSLTLAAAILVVLVAAGVIASLIRNLIPPAIRFVVQLVLVSTLVIIVDQFLLAFAHGLHRELSIFLGLVITNCMVLGRTGGFASRHPPLASFLDALRHGAGLGLVLILIGTLREFYGRVSLLGHEIWLAGDGAGKATALLLLPPGAFLLVGFLLWAVGSMRPAGHGLAGLFRKKP